MRYHRFAELLVASLPICFIFVFQALAQPAPNTNKRRPLSINQQILINYGSPSWNKDSRKIDSAFLILKDIETGKFVQIQLEETEPDSSQFTGRFSVSLNEASHISPEIYVPHLGTEGEFDYKKAMEQIEGGAMPRKPIIVKKNEKGQSIVEVYDTREQAESALKAYQEQRKIADEMQKKALIKPIPTESTLEAARQAEYKTRLEKLAFEAAKRESERVRLEQIEKQKAEERSRQEKLISERERAARKEKAAMLAEEGMALYDKSDYAAAEVKFHESVTLDPENKNYYFKYGVTLYRNQKFNEALVTLRLADLDAKTEIEKKYYMGLAHYRLAELDHAQRNFAEVAKSGDPIMGPSAEFYSGVISFTQEKYEAAKKSFETVIDTSKDPHMDEQAEDYLDRIASAMVYRKMREHKFSVMGVLGLMYDSNVLLYPDNAADQGLPTDVADLRLLTITEVGYRPVFNEHHEWSVILNAGLTNSAKNQSAPADPYIYNLSLPYSYKGVLWNKGYKFTAKPAHEILYMDPSATGKKSLVLTSELLTLENTFVMSKNWFSSYVFEYRHDASTAPDSTGPDNESANKFSIRAIQSVFLDKSRKQAVMGNLGFVDNVAIGANKRYLRYEIGANYIKPIFWNSSLTAGLNIYQLHYPSASTSRDDRNLTVSLGMIKPIRDWVTWGVTGSYTKNNSTVSQYQYTKYTVLTTATFYTVF